MYVSAQAKSIEELPESPPESPSSDTPKLLGSFSYPDPHLSQKIDVKSNDFLPGRFVTIVSRDPKYPIILSEVRVYGRDWLKKEIGSTTFTLQLFLCLLSISRLGITNMQTLMQLGELDDLGQLCELDELGGLDELGELDDLGE